MRALDPHISRSFLTSIRFAAGKGSALVIDIGQSMASVTPVVDGFVLRKGNAHPVGVGPIGVTYLATS